MSVSTYEKFRKLTLPIVELKTFGFPRIHPEDARKALVFGTAKQHYYSNKHSRLCRRCGLKFEVDEHGKTKEDTCLFHPYRLRRRRYQCCGGAEGNPPCKKAMKHVHDHVNVDEITGFMLTKKQLYYRNAVYSLSCSWVYTENGKEIASISIVDTFSEVVYETKVRPEGDILDYNSEQSGLKETDLLDEETPTMQQVRGEVRSLITSNVIVVGFCLQKDMIALRLIHDSVVEITALYPRKRGLITKNSLYHLRKSFLSWENISVPLKSRENAIIAMKLALHKA